jgi:hypothetical protein
MPPKQFMSFDLSQALSSATSFGSRLRTVYSILPMGATSWPEEITMSRALIGAGDLVPRVRLKGVLSLSAIFGFGSGPSSSSLSNRFGYHWRPLPLRRMLGTCG